MRWGNLSLFSPQTSSSPGAPLLPSHPNDLRVRTNLLPASAGGHGHPRINVCTHHPSARGVRFPPGAPLQRKFPAEGTICRHGKRDQHAPDAPRAPLTVPTGAPTTFASVPHGSRREPPLPLDIFPDTSTPHHQPLRGKNSHPICANRRRWNNKLWQVEQQTAAGGHFCAPPATQNGHWCVLVPQVAKVFAHLQRYSFPPAAPRPPTCHITACYRPIFVTSGEGPRHVWGRSLFGGATFPKGSASQGSPVASQWGRSRH